MIRNFQKIITFCLILIFLAGCNTAMTPSEAPSASPAIASPQPTAQKISAMKIAGQIGGSVRSAAIKGDSAYVGVGLRVTIVDISNPSELKEMGSTESLGGCAENIVVAEDNVYISCGSAGFFAVNVSDPLQPKVLGCYDSMGYAQSAAVSGNYAYLADGPEGLRIIDITDPANMKEVGYAYPTMYAYDVATDGEYAYIAAGGAGMLVVKISDPSSPSEAGSINTKGYAYGIALSGGTAYIADGMEGLSTIDITDTLKPKETGVYDTYGWAMDVTVLGNNIYAAAANGGLRIFQISDGQKLTETGYFALTSSHFQSLAVSGNTVYAADTRQGLHIIDVSKPGAPKRAGLYDPMGWAQAVEVSGGYAYIAAYGYGMRVIDISDPSHPREANTYATGGLAYTVALNENTAYIWSANDVSGDPSGLYSLDISDPLNIPETSPSALVGHAANIVFPDSQPGKEDIYMVSRYLEVNDSMLYNSGEWGVLLMDISSPLSPKETCFLQTAGELFPESPTVVKTFISGSLAYMATSGGGLYIADVSDPKHPALLSKFAELAPAGIDGKPDKKVNVMDVAVSGKYAYIADNNNLRVIDVSDPKQPKSVSALLMPAFLVNGGGGPAKSLVVNGDTLLVADSAAGLLAVDISDPACPKILQQLTLAGHASWVSVQKDYAYVATQEGGLYIVKLNGSETQQENKVGNAEARKLTQPVGAVSGSQYEPLPLMSRKPLEFNPYKGSAGKTLKVTSTADDGPGSLREALSKAASGGIIVFDPKVFSSGNPAAIYLKSGLVLGVDGVTIDASNAGVILDGSNAPSDTSGISIGTSYNTIMGLRIINFPATGISISGSNNIIGGDRTRGTGPMGEGNLISANKMMGIGVGGDNAVGNRILGNNIGTDETGGKILGKQSTGITISSHDNCIGSENEAERNIISGNTTMGIECKLARRNLIIGNMIGTDATGKTSLGGSNWAMQIWWGSQNNRVENNVISGGVGTCDPGSSYNEIVGNRIGTDGAGLAVLQDLSYVNMGTPFNKTGGTDEKERNIINGFIAISGSDCLALNNYIGIDASGAKAFGGNIGGVNISGGTTRNIVGGATAEERNIVLGQISINASPDNFIIGNMIGADITGNAISVSSGITVVASNGNFIQLNTITGTKDAGIYLDNALYNLIKANQLKKNMIAIKANHSNSNLIIRNTISESEKIAIILDNSSDNAIFKNAFVKNAFEANDNGKNNRWDNGATGNYWDRYLGKDDNQDGIGDNPFGVDKNITDKYPLMKPFF